MSFTGKFEGKAGDKTRIVLDADNADITAGGGGRGGDVIVKNDQGKIGIRLDGGGDEGPLVGVPGLGPGGQAPPAAPNATVLISASGAIHLRDPAGKTTVATLRTRKQGAVSTGELTLDDGAGDKTITLSAVHDAEACMIVGGTHRSGWMVLRNAAGKDAAFLSGHEGSGLVELRDKAGQNTITLRAVQDDAASIAVGKKGRSGWMVLRNFGGQDAVFLSGHDFDGLLELRRASGLTTIRLDGDGSGGFGGQGVNGNLFVYPESATQQDEDQATVWIQGGDGDIVLRNADCAEEFDVDDATEVEGGAVVVLNDRGGLCVAHQPYDRRVAGVVSGAGGLRPGIVLGRDPGATGRCPVALSGKVFCQVDATYGPIEVGDLLTTSATPGHAMTAQDSARAFGAVLGKAIAPLRAGQGLIPVLVALQ